MPVPCLNKLGLKAQCEACYSISWRNAYWLRAWVCGALTSRNSGHIGISSAKPARGLSVWQGTNSQRHEDSASFCLKQTMLSKFTQHLRLTVRRFKATRPYGINVCRMCGMVTGEGISSVPGLFSISWYTAPKAIIGIAFGIEYLHI